MTDYFDYLDLAADANLSLSDLSEYRRYKVELLTEDAETLDDIYGILKGYIWNCIDAYSLEEYYKEDAE